MVMTYIWVFMIGFSVISAWITGQSSSLADAVTTGCRQGIELAMLLAGPLCLWAGVGRLSEKIGITRKLARLIRPLITFIFPSAKRNGTFAAALSGNICANLLGLGNAATPLGLEAVKALKDPAKPEQATDEMCRLIVLNTASIQLLPTTVAAVRSSLGSAAPFEILPCVWLTSLCSAGIGLSAAWIMGKASKSC